MSKLTKIYHFYDKVKKRNRYYGSIACLHQEEKLEISTYKLYTHDFKKPYDNYLYTIIESVLIRMGRKENLTNLKNGIVEPNYETKEKIELISENPKRGLPSWIKEKTN